MQEKYYYLRAISWVVSSECDVFYACRRRGPLLTHLEHIKFPLFFLRSSFPIHPPHNCYSMTVSVHALYWFVVFIRCHPDPLRKSSVSVISLLIIPTCLYVHTVLCWARPTNDRVIIYKVVWKVVTLTDIDTIILFMKIKNIYFYLVNSNSMCTL